MKPLSLGRQIAYYRKKAGLSQAELGAAVGMSANAIGYYEKNQRKPNIITLLNLAKTFNISLDTLFGLESPENAGETNILRTYRNLNDLGQDRVLEYAMILEENPKFSNNSSVVG